MKLVKTFALIFGTLVGIERKNTLNSLKRLRYLNLDKTEQVLDRS